MNILNKHFLIDIENNIDIKINLGSGESKKNGFYSLDHLELNGTDIIADLNNPLDLIPDNCIKYVYSRHVFEHIINFNELMLEIHRISKANCKIEVIVPHFSNVYAYSDPTHVRFFGLYTMYYFTPQNLQPNIRKVPDFYNNKKFIIKSIYIDFYTESIFDKLFGRLFKLFVNSNFYFQNFYERRLSRIYHAWQIKYVLEPIK
jgi:hypothetical protein